MLRNGLLIVIFLVSAAAGYAQSGRKAVTSETPKPSPIPLTQEGAVPSTANPLGYSESKPRTGRRTRATTAATPRVSDQSSQAVQTVPSVHGDGEVLRVETNLITIPVSVFDRNGLYISGLRQDEFKIYEDGVEQEIAYFATTDKPFTVALVLDVSPSTAYQIEEIRRAAAAFVDQLRPEDSVIVIEFDHGINVLTKATKDRAKIFKAINKADFGEGTSLYNAVDEALRKQLGRITGRKAVVLFTDGVDTSSRKNTYDSTLNYAEESDSLVFPIYYNTFLDNRRRLPIFLPNLGVALGTSPEDYAIGLQYLKELADATGGRVFRPESTPGGLIRAFEGIAEELRRQYSVGYVPSKEGRAGDRREIKVRVERPNLNVRARDSYTVGSAPTLSPLPSPTLPKSSQ